MAKKPDPPVLDSLPNEQRQTAPCAARRKTRSADAPSTAAATIDAIVRSPAQRTEPRNHRELAEAIFSECDPVKIGRELLESGNDKGASVRARVFETLADWQFGKKLAASTPKRCIRVIWTIPGPPRESELPPEPEPPADE